MAAPNEITVPQLMRLIGTPDRPVIVDICTDPDHAEDPYLIPGAIRHSHTDLPGLMARLDGRASVILCQKGKKLSQGVAAQLRWEGLRAEYLSGGMYGWRAHPGMMRIPAAAIPAPVNGAIRHRPKIDRIACPWLIRRFVDPGARFMFVAPAEVRAVADRFGATSFDVPEVVFSHRGAGCTFDALLEDFELRSDALAALARVVRAADTDTHGDSPQAAGLLALSVGLSRQYKDDLAQLEAGMAIYDALYRWARDGQDENHSWPEERRQ